MKAGDAIAKLRGAKAIEAHIATLTKDVDKRNADLQTAVAARDKARDAANAALLAQTETKVTALEKAYNDRKGQLTKKVEQLAPLLITAPSPGTLTVTRKVGDKLAEAAPVASLQPAPLPSVTFELPEEPKAELGATAMLRVGERPLECKVAREGKTVRMTCPNDPPLPEGAAVSWDLP